MGTDHAARRRLRPAAVATALVGVAAGLMFATGASVFAGQSSRGSVDLEQLARAESERLTRLQEDNAALRAEIETILDAGAAAGAPSGHAGPLAQTAGTVELTGPGLRVEMWDAPADSSADLPPDALVVHQQDLEAVMNALWAAGAEAMTVQGHRVVSTTGVRCVGNVLHIEGRTYSPPYRIEAVGDPTELRAALLADPRVRIYLQYVDAVGMGWSVDERAALSMPAYTGSTSLRYAEVIEGTMG